MEQVPIIWRGVTRFLNVVFFFWLGEANDSKKCQDQTGLLEAAFLCSRYFVQFFFKAICSEKVEKNFYTVELVSFSVNPVHKNSGYIS